MNPHLLLINATHICKIHWNQIDWSSTMTYETNKILVSFKWWNLTNKVKCSGNWAAFSRKELRFISWRRQLLEDLLVTIVSKNRNISKIGGKKMNHFFFSLYDRYSNSTYGTMKYLQVQFFFFSIFLGKKLNYNFHYLSLIHM